MVTGDRVFTFDDLRALTTGRLGSHDAACPICGPDRHAPANRTRRVLRIWLVSDHFATFNCMRCLAKGEAHDGSGIRVDRAALQRARQEAAARDREAVDARLRTARSLWRMRAPLKGSLAERYLRTARRLDGPLPPTLGYLPARGEYPAALIAVFGLPDEPEPGVLAIRDDAVSGIQLTRLLQDGQKAPGDAKITIGRCLGSPIVVAPMNDLLGLVIAEGVEDALSLAESTGCGAWAAGGAYRLPALADAVPDFTDFITIACDDDLAGRKGTEALLERLRLRGLRAAAVSFPDAKAAA
jgi:hypothetical protein